jgi:hypothetical protein
MASPQHREIPQPQTEQMGCLGLIVRMLWLVAGNIALLACAAFVAKGTAPMVASVLFFAVVVGLVAIRWVDVTKLKGHTSEGKPATLGDWRRYAVLLAVASAGLWFKHPEDAPAVSGYFVCKSRRVRDPTSYYTR